MSDNGSRLSRWSRMKSEARQQTRLRFSVPENEAVAPVAVAEELSDEGVPADIGETGHPIEPAAEAQDSQGIQDDAPDLPDIDDLDASSDYSAFMSDKVSDTVRNLALRKLWRTDSVFANLDGLIDYGEDFTDAATVVEGMKSVYTVGRGMVDYEAEDAAKLAAAEEEQEELEEAARLQDETDAAPAEVEVESFDDEVESEIGAKDPIDAVDSDTFRSDSKNEHGVITEYNKTEIENRDAVDPENGKPKVGV